THILRFFINLSCCCYLVPNNTTLLFLLSRKYIRRQSIQSLSRIIDFNASHLSRRRTIRRQYRISLQSLHYSRSCACFCGGCGGGCGGCCVLQRRAFFFFFLLLFSFILLWHDGSRIIPFIVICCLVGRR